MKSIILSYLHFKLRMICVYKNIYLSTIPNNLIFLGGLIFYASKYKRKPHLLA